MTIHQNTTRTDPSDSPRRSAGAGDYLAKAQAMRAAAIGKLADGTVAAIGRLGRRLAGGVAAFIERERTLRELSGLDDRMLADIGLSRADVWLIAKGKQPAAPLATGAPFAQPAEVVPFQPKPAGQRPAASDSGERAA